MTRLVIVGLAVLFILATVAGGIYEIRSLSQKNVAFEAQIQVLNGHLAAASEASRRLDNAINQVIDDRKALDTKVSKVRKAVSDAQNSATCGPRVHRALDGLREPAAGDGGIVSDSPRQP